MGKPVPGEDVSALALTLVPRDGISPCLTFAWKLDHLQPEPTCCYEMKATRTRKAFSHHLSRSSSRINREKYVLRGTSEESSGTSATSTLRVTMADVESFQCPRPSGSTPGSFVEVRCRCILLPLDRISMVVLQEQYRSQTLGKSWLSTYDDHCTVSSSDCVEPSRRPANSSPFRVLDEGALVSCAT